MSSSIDTDGRLRSAWPAMAVLAAVVALPVHAQQVPLATQVEAEERQSELAALEEPRDQEPNQQDQVDGLQVKTAEPGGFWKGSSLVVKPRTYYLNRDRDQNQDNVGWALGGSIEFKSGWAADIFQVAATVYTSQELYGPQDKDGTQLFKPGPEPFTVLGEAYLTARFGDGNGLRIGRQSFDLPWLARHDIRMAPNTFEAIAVGRQAKTGLAYIAGYVDKIKRKNDDEFIPMSAAAGAAGSDEGLGMVGAQYTFLDGSLVGFTNQTSFDVMNTFFVKAEKSFDLSDDVSIRGYAQYTDQRSEGDELIGDFATHLVSVKGELFYPNASFRLAASQAGSDRGLQSPFGGPPNYLSIIVENFDRAGEEAYMVGASYDFKGVGVEGLSAFTNISTGNTPDSGPNASPDETEYDLTVDYRFGKASALDGLWVRVRGAYIDQDENDNNGDDFFDFRIILNYAFDIF
ncbi:MAG TPA: OprD family outer membrane porin [Lysobacter sp.]